MTRLLITLTDERKRLDVLRHVREMPLGGRVELSSAQRTLPQSKLMWSLLSDVAQQVSHAGRFHPPEIWKSIFLQAMGREVLFLPTLSGDGLFPLGLSSSRLSKDEMSDLIEMIAAWGAENGIVFTHLPPPHPGPDESLGGHHEHRARDGSRPCPPRPRRLDRIGSTSPETRR